MSAAGQVSHQPKIMQQNAVRAAEAAAPLRRQTPASEPPSYRSMPGSPLVRIQAESFSLPSVSEAGPLPASAAEVLRSPGAGEPLSASIAAPIVSSMRVDPSPVRVHNDSRASQAADILQARAFTWGNHIFLGSGQKSSDTRLMAHEVTHVVQQQGNQSEGVVRNAVQRDSLIATTATSDAYENEARRTSEAVTQGSPAQVTLRTASGPAIQRDWVPGFVRSAASSVASGIRAVGSAVADAAGNFLQTIVNHIKERARTIPGYDLLGVILGRDPITQQPVERNAVNLLRGIAGLIPGGMELFENLQRSQVIQRAYEWVLIELGKLNLTWTVIRGAIETFLGTLGIADLANLGRVFDRARAIFGPILTRIGDFAVAAGRKILEFIFEGALALAGSAGQRVLGIFRRIQATFGLIVSDPVRFLSNLLNAVKGGFQRFLDNILTHLKNALFEWLFGALSGAGLQLPQKWDLMGILSLVLQILGLTYARMRERLVRVIGEPAVAFIEKAFEFISLIVTRSLSAAWEKILEFATNLVDTVIDGIKNFVITTIVKIAVTRLATMFNPVGAIINAIITIYNTIMFIIERAQQIAALVEAVVDSIDNIARGNLSAAIAYVERTLARFLSVAINFLANLIGLGGISNKIREVIQRIQATVDMALDKVINWVVNKVKSLIAGKGAQQPDPSKMNPTQRKEAAKAEVEGRLATGIQGDQLAQLLDQVKNQYKLSKVEIDRSDQENIQIHYFASNGITTKGKKKKLTPITKVKDAPVAPTFEGEQSLDTPYGAVKRVYPTSINENGKWLLKTSTWIRPKKAEAVIAGIRPGGSRPPVIGDSGHVGNDEHFAVRGVEQSYHGGHLIGLKLAGEPTNEQANLAPQLGSFNSGTYLQIETMVKNSPVPQSDPASDQPDFDVGIKMEVSLEYSGAHSVSFADLKKHNLVAANAVDKGPVSIQRRVPKRWTMALKVKQSGFVLVEKPVGEGTKMAEKNKGTADNKADFITNKDKFVWWIVGKTPSTAKTKEIGGVASQTIVAQQAEV